MRLEPILYGLGGHGSFEPLALCHHASHNGQCPWPLNAALLGMFTTVERIKDT